MPLDVESLATGVGGGGSILALGYFIWKRLVQVSKLGDGQVRAADNQEHFVDRLMARITALEEQMVRGHALEVELTRRAAQAEADNARLEEQLSLYEHTWTTQENALNGCQLRIGKLEAEVARLKTVIVSLGGDPNE